MVSTEACLGILKAKTSFCRYNVTRSSFIGCMRKMEVFSRGTTKINLEDEDALYIGMYRGCRLQVLVARRNICNLL